MSYGQTDRSDALASEGREKVEVVARGLPVPTALTPTSTLILVVAVKVIYREEL